MIKINLLSPVDKENLRWEKVNNLAIRSVLWIFLAEAMFAALFLFTVEYLRIERESVGIQLENMKKTAETKEIQHIESGVASYKDKIEGIYSIQKGHKTWTFLFEELANLVPEGVRLESVWVQEGTVETVNSSKKLSDGIEPGKLRITIRGNAKTRDDLLILEDNLKNSGLFSDIKYDDANYVKAVDISFNHIFYVEANKLLK